MRYGSLPPEADQAVNGVVGEYALFRHRYSIVLKRVFSKLNCTKYSFPLYLREKDIFLHDDLMELSKKRGRTRKYEEPPEHYGMNVPKGGKSKIVLLAKILDKPANEAIMQIIEEKLTEMGVIPGKKKRISIDELMSLSEEEQDRIVEEQMLIAERLDEKIEDNADMIVD